MRASLWLALAAGCANDDHPSPDAAVADVDAAIDAGAPDGAAPEVPECPVGLGLDTTTALGPGQVRAGRIDDPSALLGGPSADGRLGDFKLYNDRVAFVIQSERLGDNYVVWGGSPIDADLVRAPGEPGGDVVDELVATPGIAAFAARCVGVVADGESGEAVVRAVGSDATVGVLRGLVESLGLSGFDPFGLIVVNEYRLQAGSASLEITTRIVNPGRRTLPLDLGDFMMLSDDGVDPFDTGPGGLGRTTVRAPIVGVVGEASHFAVGVFGERLIDANYLGISQLLADTAGGDLALFVYRISSVSLGRGESVELRRWLAVGHDVDDLVRERQRLVPEAAVDAVRLHGVVREEGTDEPVAGARVHVVSDDSYGSAAMTDPQGRWEVSVPAGAWRVTATGATIGQDVMVPNRPAPEPPFAAGRAPSATVEVPAGAPDEEIALVLGRAVPVELTLLDETGTAVAGKVTFAFPDGVDPRPPDPVLGERRPYPWASNVFWTSDGRITGWVPPGRYRMTGSSGFDRELDGRDVELEPGTTFTATLSLARAIERPGYVTLDAHLHAAPSIHGEVTLEERLVTNLAEGLDAMCASDHDRVVDYGPALARTGLAPRMVVLPSEEVSTFFRGHFNPYPVLLRPELPDNGRIAWWDRTNDEIFREALGPMGAIVVQVNHGGGTGRGAFFNAAGFDPATGEIGEPENWSELFNVIELQNGKGGADRQIPIYYALLRAGHRVGITGVSDSHHRIPEAGYARTYVHLGDEPAAPETIAIAVASGRTVVSAGAMAFLRAQANGVTAAEGETLSLDGPGVVTLSLRVEAPSWAPVETVTLVQEGVDVETIEPRDGAPVWLDTTREVPVDRDTWFVLRADGTSDLSPAYPGGEPFAFTGAVFVDLP